MPTMFAAPLRLCPVSIRSVQLGCAAGLLLGSVGGCSRQPSTPPPKKAVAAPSGVSASTTLQLATGFKYAADEFTPDFPDIATIRLGERIRIYHRGPWTPASMALLDEQGNVVFSFRIDLPPCGTVTGTFPTGVAFAKLRITSAAEPFETRDFEKKVGLDGPELTADQLFGLGIFQTERLASSSNDGVPNGQRRTAGIQSHEMTIDPNFGRIAFFAGAYSYSGTADEWRGDGPATDAHWLNKPLRDAIEAAQGTAQGRP